MCDGGSVGTVGAGEGAEERLPGGVGGINFLNKNIIYLKQNSFLYFQIPSQIPPFLHLEFLFLLLV